MDEEEGLSEAELDSLLKELELDSTPTTEKGKKLKVVWTELLDKDMENALHDSTMSVLDDMDKPDTLEPEMTKFRVGYWRGVPHQNWQETAMVTDFPDCPKVEDFIDPTWSKEERNKVVEYLGLGDEKHRFMGYSTCRICGKHNNGDACLTDGKWVWPSGLAHYLMKHNVKPPQEFIDWVNQNFDTLKKHWEDDLNMKYAWEQMNGVHTKRTSMIKFLYKYHEGD